MPFFADKAQLTFYKAKEEVEKRAEEQWEERIGEKR